MLSYIPQIQTRNVVVFFKLGAQKVGCNMEMETPETMPTLSRLCMYRYKARQVEVSVSRSSMFYPLPGFDEEHMTISHYLPASVSSVEQLGVKVQIWCHSREGIEVLLHGPSFGPSFNPQRYVDREVEGIPKDFSSYSNVNIDKYMLPSIRPHAASSNLSATGAINSVNAVTNGDHNNSIYNNCNFY
ncbi:hypothetical protein L6164_003034 [Bauhinia variegata]|uniref:Uncharacterized protein n=1 Tax=Bauhinia variegata TaxID=167791 RepID=A0ACB9Q022_BAUVA|nr:hypothetical protein L6164_003034 [Bauhinia variegata]